MAKEVKLSSETISFILTAEEVSKRYNLAYVPEIIAFGTLATITNSPLHTYLLRNGLSHMDVVKQVNKMYVQDLQDEISYYNHMYEEYMNGENCDEIFMQLTFYFAENERKIVFTKTFFEIVLMSAYIAKEGYNAEEVTNDYIFAAFTEKLSDVYLDFIESALGGEADLPETALDNCDILKPGEEIEIAILLQSNSNNQNETKAIDSAFYNSDIVLPRALESFLTVMNNKYSPEEKYCKILGRQKETQSLVKILAKATKRNAILVGEPGVGKTAIVEKFVWDIVHGECFDRFKDKIVLNLDVTSIIAGTKYRGTAEERFQLLIKFLESHPNCILFIDEIHTVLGAGACKDGELDLANALKPILARGDTQVIGATTFDEYNKYFSQDGALRRRFEKIVVKEPKTDELYEMIKNQIRSLEEFHHTTISRELIDFTVLIASCFNFETKNPDRTLDLLDKSMATAELNGKSEVTKKDILDNFDIRMSQFEKMSMRDKMAVAYHEAGHYIVQRFSTELNNYNTLAISIMPAEDYMGINVYEIDENVVASSTRKAYIQLIARALGGRIAEKIYTDELSSGASSDLSTATKIAQKMVTEFGLAPKFTKRRILFNPKDMSLCTDKMADSINSEMDKIIEEAGKYASELLKEHEEELKKLVESLMQKGIMAKSEIDAIFSEESSLVNKADLVEN